MLDAIVGAFIFVSVKSSFRPWKMNLEMPSWSLCNIYWPLKGQENYPSFEVGFEVSFHIRWIHLTTHTSMRQCVYHNDILKTNSYWKYEFTTKYYWKYEFHTTSFTLMFCLILFYHIHSFWSICIKAYYFIILMWNLYIMKYYISFNTDLIFPEALLN